jgi:TetR/AcrR family transcriptional repressor of bet genes
MARPEMKSLRQKQLIEATLASVALHGLHHTTINTISGLAGMSSGIISHYFGGKQGLIEATQQHLLEQLKQALLVRVSGKTLSPKQRLFMIVEANFTELQRSTPATKTWLSFWSQAMHEPGLARLQNINNRRLYSNLRFSFRQLFDEQQATNAAKQAAAMIDGFWLRSALSQESELAFSQSEQLCKEFIETLVSTRGEKTCH